MVNRISHSFTPSTTIPEGRVTYRRFESTHPDSCLRIPRPAQRICGLAELVPNAEAASMEPPLDVQVRAPDAAGAALQAAFVVDRDSLVFEPIDVSRAEIQASLRLAVFQTFFPVNDLQMAFRVNLEPVQE